MLVLSRKRRESIHIGDAITIVVLELGNNVVKLGIDAPLHIPVIRAELRAKPLDIPTEPSEDLA